MDPIRDGKVAAWTRLAQDAGQAPTGTASPPPAIPPAVSSSEATTAVEGEQTGEIPIGDVPIFARDLAAYAKINDLVRAMPQDVGAMYNRLTTDFDRQRAWNRYHEILQNLRQAIQNPELRDAMSQAGLSDETVTRDKLNAMHMALQEPYEDASLNEAMKQAYDWLDSDNFPNIATAMTAYAQEMQQSFRLASTTWERKTAQMEQAPANSVGPLEAQEYSSLQELEDALVKLGPYRETYDKLLGQVGEEDQDSAKSALTAFFQGFPEGLCSLYGILVKAGIAEPIDSNIVERIMQNHPQIAEDNKPKKASAEYAGLWLPPADSGLFTAADSDKEVKTASGGVGGPSPAYYTHGPGENRYCPKLRNAVNTFVCRYHCLDGLAIDDHQVVCGEALWRQNIMDKYSREYRDKDGNWVGGYINKRFEVERSTHEHPYQLKPGQRHAPINEDAWSYEKRLQEMRSSEGSKRNYSETPGDPDGLYNWDSYDFHGTPKNPQVFEKKKDSISKLASNDWTRTARMERDTVPGKQCSNPQCGKNFGIEAMVCDNCGAKLISKSRGAYQMDNDAIPGTQRMMSSDTEVKTASGVYYVTVDGRNFYGKTPAEAQAKSKGLGNLQAPSLEEATHQIQKNMDMTQSAPAQKPAPTGIQGPLDPTPTTPEKPMSMAPEPKGEDLQAEPVAPEHLDMTLNQTVMSKTPEEQQQWRREHEGLGLGPDPKNSTAPMATMAPARTQ